MEFKPKWRWIFLTSCGIRLLVSFALYNFTLKITVAVNNLTIGCKTLSCTKWIRINLVYDQLTDLMKSSSHWCSVTAVTNKICKIKSKRFNATFILIYYKCVKVATENEIKSNTNGDGGQSITEWMVNNVLVERNFWLTIQP